MSSTLERPDDSVKTALEEIVESGQQLVLARLDLMRLELQDTIKRGAKGARLMAFATFAGAIGWIALMVAAVMALNTRMPAGFSVLVVGLFHVGLAAACWAFGRRVLPHPLDKQDESARANGWTHMGAQHRG